MYRVAIIGCGSISAVHAQVLEELEDTQLIACADVIPERASRYGCAAYTDWLSMLDREHPDAVHLCTPHYLHPVMAAEAARRGIAVEPHGGILRRLPLEGPLGHGGRRSADQPGHPHPGPDDRLPRHAGPGRSRDAQSSPAGRR